LAKSRAASELQLGHGGIDISDGLGDDLRRLCGASQTGVVLNLDQIPISDQARRLALAVNIPPWTLPFASGGDFQFLLSTSQYVSKELWELGFDCIGEITAEPSMLVCYGGKLKGTLPAGGHRDIRSQTFATEMLAIIREVQYALGNV